MQKGWIRLHRKMLTNEIFKHDKNAKLLFVDLLMLVDRHTGSYTTGRFMLAEITGLKPTTVYKSLLRLEKAKMVTLNSNNRFTLINISKWREYQSDEDNADNNKVTTKGQQKDTKQEAKKLRIKKNTNTTNVVLAEPPEKFGNSNINLVFEYWHEVTGAPITSLIKSNRFAANNLLKKYGMDKLKKIIDGVVMARSDPYAPRIANFVQLQAKFDELIVWGKQKNKSSEVVIIR